MNFRQEHKLLNVLGLITMKHNGRHHTKKKKNTCNIHITLILNSISITY